MTRDPRRRHPSHVIPVPALSLAPTRADISPLRRALHSDLWCRELVEGLVAEVGSIDALEQLDVEPLPSEPFEWAGIANDDRPIVETILDAVEGKLPWLIDDEYRTIVHRLLARIARRDAAALRRGNHRRVAAGLVWLAVHGNGEMAVGRRHRVTATEVWHAFRVSPSADRGRALAEAAGFPAHDRRYSSATPWSDVWRADPSVLHSRARRRLVQRREDAVLHVERAEAERERNRPIQRNGNLVMMRGRPLQPRWAVVGTLDGTDRWMVSLSCGDTTDEEIFAITVPDAHRLVQLLRDALDRPRRRPTG